MLKIKKSDVYDAAKRYMVSVDDIINLLQDAWFQDKGNQYIFDPNIKGIIKPIVDDYASLNPYLFRMTPSDKEVGDVIIAQYSMQDNDSLKDKKQIMSALVSILPKPFNFFWENYIITLPWYNFIKAYESKYNMSFLETISEILEKKGIESDDYVNFMESIGYNNLY